MPPVTIRVPSGDQLAAPRTSIISVKVLNSSAIPGNDMQPEFSLSPEHDERPKTVGLDR